MKKARLVPFKRSYYCSTALQNLILPIFFSLFFTILFHQINSTARFISWLRNKRQDREALSAETPRRTIDAHDVGELQQSQDNRIAWSRDNLSDCHE
jgi:hypothetical protein